MINIGCYTLNIEDMVLSRNGNDVVLEPKVLSVLLYFCENKDRYITMAELHENIWKDRCVSDAAVRRIISKIRLLFDDDHKSPKYIQSLPKRGYKLICSVEFDVTTTKTKEQDNFQPTPIKQFENKSLPIKKTSKPNYIYLSLISVTVLICVFIFADFFTREHIELKTSHETLSTIPGSKIAVEQSLNSEYLAFSGKVSESAGLKVFIKHKDNHEFKAVVADVHFPFSLAFSRNNQRLFFSDLKEDNSSIYQVTLDDTKNKYTAKKIIDNFYLIGDVFHG